MPSNSPESHLSAALAAVDVDRLADRLTELCAIESPTGDTLAVSEAFAADLEALGCKVQLYRKYPATPVVIGVLDQGLPGPRLVLNGHLDTVPIPHPPACRREGQVYGRGSIDMKGGLCAAVEAVRAARQAGLRWNGSLVICAHGLHEAPGGHAEDLVAALHEGVVTGDAAIVLEVGHDALPLAGLGSGIYRAHFRREDPVTHELMTPAGTPHPAAAAAEGVMALNALNAELSRKPWELAGPESVFVGQVHSGDFFNRFPNHAWIEGTRRYSPEMTAEDARRSVREVLEPIAVRHGLTLEVEFEKVRDGFRVGGDHPLAQAIQSSYREETGRELPITGIKIVADAPVFQKEAGIPCLYHGLEGSGAHGDLESVAEAELGRGARTYLRIISAFLGEGAAEPGAG